MKLIVNPHKCEIERTPVNELEVNVTTVDFEFSEEIPNNLVKEAYFTLGENTYKVIINNNTCNIPNEVLTKKGQITIGVVAFEVINNETLIRFNPSPAYFSTLEGSLKEADNTEPITPSEMEQFEAQLQEGLNAIDDKIDEVDTKLETIDDKLEEVDTAIEETNNLNIDVNKVEKETTITLTKKDNTTKSVVVLDGTSLQFMWQGTSLGIKTDNDSEYTFVNLQGVQGVPGPQGEPFRIKKTYPSVRAMNADFNNMNYGDYVMIASTVEVEDNAKLYTRGEFQWIFITDFSGATGIKGETGATPNIQIGTVTSGSTPNVTRTGTDENPILNFTLVKGDKGDKGDTGETGATGNGVVGITKTSTSGLVDTYTMTYTNGNSDTFEVTNGQNGEVTQAQLDEVQADLDRYKTIENALPHITGEGESITLDNTANSVLHLNLKGNTSQASEPTPSTPVDINVVSGDNTIEICGKNLFDGILEQGSLASGYPTTTTTRLRSVNYTRVEPNTPYIAKVFEYDTTKDTPNVIIVEYDNNQTYIQQTTWGSTYQTITTTNETKYIKFIIKCGGAGTTEITPTYITQIQLEKSSTATTYEAYTGQSQLISLGTIELCKIGDYQDYIYKDNDKWYLHKEIGKVVLDGSERWSRETPQGIPNNYYINIPNSLGGNTQPLLNNIGKWNSSLVVENYSTYISSGKNLNFRCDEITSVVDFKTLLSTTNMIIYYPLATPTNTEITDTTLIGQLDNIEKLMSYEGQTNISQENNDEPFIFSASALKKIE